MSDEPKREPFAGPIPPRPPTLEEQEAEREAERERLEQISNAPQEAPKPMTDEHVYTTEPTREPRATHHAMSTEQLAELGYNEDGQPEDGEPQPIEPEQPPEEEEQL